MSELRIDTSKCVGCRLCIRTCPFNALAFEDGQVRVNANCRMCASCVNVCPVDAIKIDEDRKTIDKSLYRDIVVVAEVSDQVVQPVTYELIGEALKLATVNDEAVHCIVMGHHIFDSAKALLGYGLDHIYVMDDAALSIFRCDVYANALYHFLSARHDNVVLIPASVNGRSLAPALAARLHTGLTADCTQLQMKDDGDLVQIRPAFGGNIMAMILNSHARPQMATVREKVMDSANKIDQDSGVIESLILLKDVLVSPITIDAVHDLPKASNISAATQIIVIGRGVATNDYPRIHALAKALDATIAYTRPLVEKGIGDVLYQIGLSGRSVKADWILTLGVSGAIQFTAGMDQSNMIMAVNTDPNAPIFKIASLAMVCDVSQWLDQWEQHYGKLQ